MERSYANKFCWETLGSGIHVDVTLTKTTYLNIIAGQVHPFMESRVYNCSCVSLHCVTLLKSLRDSLKNMIKIPGFPRSQYDQASLGCARETSPVLWGPTLPLKGTWRICCLPLGARCHSFVHALKAQSCLCGTWKTYIILGRWFYCHGW